MVGGRERVEGVLGAYSALNRRIILALPSKLQPSQIHRYPPFEDLYLLKDNSVHMGDFTQGGE